MWASLEDVKEDFGTPWRGLGDYEFPDTLKEQKERKEELLNNHDARPNTILYWSQTDPRSPRSEYYYVSSQPGMYRQPILLKDYKDVEDSRIVRFLVRPVPPEEQELYGLFLEGIEARQNPLRAALVAGYYQHAQVVAEALPQVPSRIYTTLLAPLASWSLKTEYSDILREITELRELEASRFRRALGPQSQALSVAVSQLEQMYRFMQTWTYEGTRAARANRLKQAVWPTSYLRRGWVPDAGVQEALQCPYKFQFWGVGGNSWLPLLGLSED